jgi:hypothetical protein
MTLNIYRLGESFGDVAATGQDDLLQLGNEDSYHDMVNIAQEQKNASKA